MDGTVRLLSLGVGQGSFSGGEDSGSWVQVRYGDEDDIVVLWCSCLGLGCHGSC